MTTTASGRAVRILVVVGTPLAGSLNHGLATEYVDSATAAGADVRVIDLASDPIPAHPTAYGHLRMPRSDQDLALDAEVERYIDEVRWADHLVFFFPQWWGTYPAALKAFVDRVFLSGEAFRYHQKGQGWDRGLRGRTARIVTTLDGPSLWSRLVYGSNGERALRIATLRYVGIRALGTTRFDKVRHRDSSTYEKWIASMSKVGTADASLIPAADRQEALAPVG